MTRDEVTRHLATLAAAGIVLAPLATTGLPFRTSLMIRAAIVCGCTALVAVAAITSAGWLARLRAAPRPLRVGVWSYGAAAALGTAVALVRGNDTVLIAGQLLSMALLPAAAVAGLALPRQTNLRRCVTRGVVVSVSLGCWLQLGWWLCSLLQGRLEDRLFLPNMASVVAPALLALVLALTMTARPEPWSRRLAWLAVVSIAVVVVGSAVRGLWALVLPSLVLFTLLWPRWLRALRPRAWVAVATVLILLIGANLLLESHLSAPCASLLPEDPRDLMGSRPSPSDRPAEDATAAEGLILRLPHAQGYTSRLYPVDQTGAYLLRACVTARGVGSARLLVHWLSARQRHLGTTGIRTWAGDDRGVVRRFSAAPRGTRFARIRVRAEDEARGVWAIRQISLCRLGRPALAPLLRQRQVWAERLGSLLELARGRVPARDPALRFRLTESATILSAFSDSSFWSKALGHGLGATVHLGIHGYDNRGNWIWYGEVNYIHNFYLFLLYKLGVVGTALVATALLVWIAFTLGRCRRAATEEVRAFLAAATTAWFAYCAWSLTSPEILDFRMAPLWGLLLAATAQAEGPVEEPAID